VTLNRRQLIRGSVASGTGLLLGRSSTKSQDPGFPGSILFTRNGDIWVWRAGNAERLIEDGNLLSPRWSPAGEDVLHVRKGNSFSDLYLTNLPGNYDIPLTANEYIEAQIGSPTYVENSVWVVDPSWSLSGRIAYASDSFTPYGTLSLWTMEWPGATPQMFTNVPLEQGISGISISSSGAYVAFVTRDLDAQGNYVSYIGIRDLTTWAVTQLMWEPEGAFDPAMEPNGSRVACSTRRGGISDIWLIDRLGAEPVQVTAGKNAIRPVWYPDASYLAWYQVVDFKFECWGASVSGTQIGEPRKLYNFGDIDAESGMSWFW
jgi:Tol biopolymer transport system component